MPAIFCADSSCAQHPAADLDGANGANIVDFALSAEDGGLKPVVSLSNPTDTLVINEFMASNSGSIQDPQGQYDDWIEIYNYGTSAVNIGGMYLTDNLSVPTKWRIPDGIPAVTTIPPQDFLLIWTDNDTTDTGLHANIDGLGFSLTVKDPTCTDPNDWFAAYPPRPADIFPERFI